MNPSIFEKLTLLQKRHKKVQELLNNSNNEKNIFLSLSREYAYLNNIIYYFINWKNIQKDINKVKKIINDPEMHAIAQEELKKIKKINEDLENKLNMLLLPKDPDDERNCFIEIRAGTGGHEAARFAGNLLRMYSRYTERKRWNMEMISIHYGEKGGYKEVIIKVLGDGAYGKLKFESGGHRVQRIPETESQGRMHTSACTVAVLPEIKRNEIQNIPLVDLKIDTFRSSGAGGQHVNTTDSAIRITHLPTGIVVECQDERSQHKNKYKAMSVLCSRIWAENRKKKNNEKYSTLKKLLSSGDRSDRNRTYHFPKGRITDHRINFTIYRLEEIMEGNLDLLIIPIVQEYKKEKISLLSNQLCISTG